MEPYIRKRNDEARTSLRSRLLVAAITLLTTLAVFGVAGTTASAAPLPLPTLRSCTTAKAGEQCDLSIDLATDLQVNEGPEFWSKHQSDESWQCTQPEQDLHEASSTCNINLPVQIICVSVTVVARVAGSGSISVTGKCNPLPSASCTATTGLLGFGACQATHAHAGILPSVCHVKTTGAVAGGGSCIFTYAVF